MVLFVHYYSRKNRTFYCAVDLVPCAQLANKQKDKILKTNQLPYETVLYIPQ